MNEKEDAQKKKTNKYIHKRIKCQQCEKKFNKESTFNTHMKSYHEDQGMDVEVNLVNSINNIIETNNLNEMTSQYHLRRPRVPQKQCQLSNYPSV